MYPAEPIAAAAASPASPPPTTTVCFFGDNPLRSPGTGGGVSVHLDHILHQPQPAIALERQDGFRMELYAFDWQIAMTDTHDDAVLRLRGDLETGGKCVAIRI